MKLETTNLPEDQSELEMLLDMCREEIRKASGNKEIVRVYTRIDGEEKDKKSLNLNKS